MSRQLLLDDWCGETRAALLDHDRLAGLSILRHQDQPQPGDIFDGRVVRLDGSLNAAFIALGTDVEAFLPASEVIAGQSGKPAIKHLLQEGQMLRVMVLRGPSGDKGIRLTTALTLVGRYVVLRPFSPGAALPAALRGHKKAKELQTRLQKCMTDETPGLLGRSQLLHASDADLSREVDDLMSRWTNLPPLTATPGEILTAPRGLERLLRDLVSGDETIIVDGHTAFAHAQQVLSTYQPDAAAHLSRAHRQGALFRDEGVDAEIESLLSTRVDLPGGAWLSVEETKALVAIDVNSGGDSGSAVQPRRSLELNLRAIPEIVRQIRLRGAAGQIVVDFPRMKGPADLKQVTQAMTKAFAGDPQPVRLFGFSAMGLFELTRRRGGPSLREILCGADGKPSLETKGHALLQELRLFAYSQAGGQLQITCDAALKDWLMQGPLKMAQEHIAQAVEVRVSNTNTYGIRRV